MKIHHALLVLAAAIIVGALIVVELPKLEAQWAADKLAKKEAAAESDSRKAYATRADVRLMWAKASCQEAVKEWVDDPSPIFTELDDWPAKELSPEHFAVDLEVRARGTYAGYKLLHIHCVAAHNLATDGWNDKLTIQE